MPVLRSGLPLLMALALAASGCERLELSEPSEAATDEDAEPTETPAERPTEEASDAPRRVDSRPPPMAQPVPLWERGATERNVDAATAAQHGRLVLDLGESWTPYLFTEADGPDGERIEHAYRGTYLALARGEFPDDHHGARAERDKYLELFGIMPTLGLIRERFRRVRDLACREELDLSALEGFDGFVAYRNNRHARRRARHFGYLESQVEEWLEAQEAERVEELDEERLDDRARRSLREYRDLRPEVEAIRAAQDRLECEGYFEGKGDYTRGALDWATHEALAEFERRHRVYGWGFVGRETLVRLRQSPMELEREAVVRVLTERAMHALGVLEDGSAPSRGDGPPTFVGRDGAEHEVPNLEARLREHVVEALGLTTPEATLDFLEGLGELTPDSERLVAIQAPELPEYYSDDMDIRVEIDRGDVWYEFPYDEEGRERSQPVQRRPRVTVYVDYEDQRIPLARFGTTIGGWRSEEIGGQLWWKYKNSPTGPRVWHQIVSAPVWMPPASTPSRDLVRRVPGRSGAEAYRVNHHETGPSYASAYGLVAAYHRLYSRNEDGSIDLRGDEGIRTHGSVDYMSIMRRHSHGCHRLHNHIAVRLMSWMLAHRRHTRVGHEPAGFHRTIEHEGHTYQLDIERGGYVFDLERPVPVRVLEGRIRGNRATPIQHAMPRYDQDRGAYVLPDGGPVRVTRHGGMTRYELDAGVDGGMDAGLSIVNPFE
ncbi:MAG TPA: hypothetical protein RMH99_12580 [Sandaracinaceae bacterium LLY-WYZ-13_1]|nr:hypothetical protein [Sandaracinaceae bacterium LLY-WYZ-13_1]